jgi:phosphate transport system substrate-binding protein
LVRGPIDGAGSTFQESFQLTAAHAFELVNPGATVSYNPAGSSAGRLDLAQGSVLFAGSDSPVPASERAEFNGKTVLYFPVQLGAVALAFNLTGISSLKLDATTLAEIFQGSIKTWNDPAIKTLNPGVNLPSTAIAPVGRSDPSAATQNFSLFLSRAAGGAWKLGSGSTITWPTAVHVATGSSGVAQAVKFTPGSIGYVDDSAVAASSLTVASIKNKAGDFVAPSAAGATAAAASASLAADLTFDPVWQAGATAYPITYPSWDLTYTRQPNQHDAALLKAYLGFLLSPRGQTLLASLGLAPLPPNIDHAAIAQLSKITS